MYIPKTETIEYDEELLKEPFEGSKYLTSKTMNKMYTNIYKMWNIYRIKKYSIIKNKLNEDTTLKIIEYIMRID